jgi:dolichol kinase
MSWWIAGTAFVTLVGFQFVISRSSTSAATTKKQDEPSGDDGSISGKSNNTDSLQLRRKIQHCLSGLGIAYFLQYQLTQLQTAITLLISSLFVYGMHRARLIWPSLNHRLIASLGPILRHHEHRELPGAAYVLLGCGIVTLCSSSRTIALLSIIYLSIGDPMASLVGQLAGNKRRRWSFGKGDKSIVGSVAMAIVCALSTAIVLIYTDALHHGELVNNGDSSSGSTRASPMSISGFIRWCVIGGLVSAASEAIGSFHIDTKQFGIFRLDDNLSVPVGSAIGLTIAVIIGLLPPLI